MIDRIKLRDQYKKETGEHWKTLSSTAQPTIEYTKWLEDKLVKNCSTPDVRQSLPIESSDVDDWLGENRDIWHHPYISDRTNSNAYEVAQLIADFANSIIRQ